MKYSKNSINREMNNDFLRLIPGALSIFNYEILPGNSEILIYHPHGKINIKLSPETTRSIGSLRLPVTEVEITFSHLSQQEATKFLNRFDLYYQKGGG